MSRLRKVALLGGGDPWRESELLRILLNHPHVEVTSVTDATRAGQRLAACYRQLAGLTDLRFDADAEGAGQADFVLCTAPEDRAAREIREALVAGADPRVVDLSSAHRLPDAATFHAAHGYPHPEPSLLGRFVYGLTEFHRDEIREAKRVAVPGGLALALELALAPFAVCEIPVPRVIADLKLSVTGPDSRPQLTGPPPTDLRQIVAGSPGRSPEVAECLCELARLGPPPGSLELVPHVLPWRRGLFATLYVFPATVLDRPPAALFHSVYDGEPFVRVLEAPPDLDVVIGSSICDLHAAPLGSTEVIVVLLALDDLVKGAAGQAVQCLNTMAGLEETAGLTFPGLGS